MSWWAIEVIMTLVIIAMIATLLEFCARAPKRTSQEALRARIRPRDSRTREQGHAEDVLETREK
jgi:hypothetical protein